MSFVALARYEKLAAGLESLLPSSRISAVLPPSACLQVERQQAEAERAKQEASELREYRKSLVFKVRALVTNSRPSLGAGVGTLYEARMYASRRLCPEPHNSIEKALHWFRLDMQVSKLIIMRRCDCLACAGSAAS